MKAVEIRDTWDIRERELIGPYQTIGEADAQAQRIRHYDRAGRYTVQVTNIRASGPADAAEYSTEADWAHTYNQDDRIVLDHHSAYMAEIDLHGEVGA